MWGSEFIGKGIKSLFGGVNSVVQTFTGSKKERDKYSHEQFTSTQSQFSSEFHTRNKRTLWDSFWDGINRMPRPLFVVLIVGYFLLSYINPGEFQILNIGLSTVPEKMWYVLSAIIGFYFCARELHKIREGKNLAIDPKQFSEMRKQIEDLRSGSKKEDEDLEDIDNPSIEEWLKKQRKN